MTSITIEFAKNDDVVIASAGDITVGRPDVGTAAADLVRAYEAVNGDLFASSDYCCEECNSVESGPIVTFDNVAVGQHITALSPDRDSYYVVEEVTPTVKGRLTTSAGEDYGLVPFANLDNGEFRLHPSSPVAAVAVDLTTAHTAAQVTQRAMHPTMMRALIEEQLDSMGSVYIEGTHADGSSMESRVIEPQRLEGNLLGGYDYLSDEYRNFRLDKLTFVSVHPDDIAV